MYMAGLTRLYTQWLSQEHGNSALTFLLIFVNFSLKPVTLLAVSANLKQQGLPTIGNIGVGGSSMGHNQRGGATGAFRELRTQLDGVHFSDSTSTITFYSVVGRRCASLLSGSSGIRGRGRHRRGRASQRLSSATQARSREQRRRRRRLPHDSLID